jgi:WD40 repeat protein
VKGRLERVVWYACVCVSTFRINEELLKQGKASNMSDPAEEKAADGANQNEVSMQQEETEANEDEGVIEDNMTRPEGDEEEDVDDGAPSSRPAISAVVSIANDPLLDESLAIAAADLVRPLQPWEISRDHLVFGDMCGLDQGKRHVVHVLESPQEGTHGGVILTAAGNTVQILTLAADAVHHDAFSSGNVTDRKYLFGTSGAGIGALAVHASERFFAVAEKGIKPTICVYQYPACRVCRVLRNGTEFSYSSVSFSQDGETLASVGGAPDFLLTVWNWRQQQTILRCKAFGQDVFSVRFAPNDAGFLTTSGVGHIRFWKMASTFTGLKLQGDIGKFGKSELSDIEAFCVLPDKKVLSGTERGVLLLWDGNFIKCEILTSRRHVPHAGKIHVVQYEPKFGQIVTAGSDGTVKFWSFDAIDKADTAPDEAYALVPMKRQVVVKPQLDIRAVVRCGERGNRYLVQSADGAIHLLQFLDTATSAIDGQSYEVIMDFVANPTGRAAGVVCSPYEHLAVSCGHDGSVRAWDYVQRACLFAASTTVLSKDENDGTPIVWAAAATAITWVPSISAMPTNASGSGSRQVIVGFSDGLVRVLLMDLARKSFVRTNVFKPHSDRVTALQFSHSGVLLVTASADATFFLFKIVPSPKTSKYAKFPPDYIPLGFQKVSGAIRSIVWRDDDEAVLLTTVAGAVIEFTIPVDGSLEALANLRSQSNSESTIEGDDQAAKESETYALTLSSRTFTTLQRQRPLSTKELASLEALGATSGHPLVDDAVRTNFHNTEGTTTTLLAWTACYYSSDTLLLSIKSPLPSGGSSSIVLCRWDKPTPLRELATEPTTPVVSLALSRSRKYVLAGLANGKIHVRTMPQPHAFLTGEFHDGAHFPDGCTHAVLSFDDSFVVAGGADGNVSISRLHSEKMELAARLLSEKFEKAVAEATIAGEQAWEKQKAQLDMLQKAAADEAKNNGDDSGGGSGATAGGGLNALEMLPAFQRAKAYAAYMETQLDGSGPDNNVATDDEVFQGVVRLVSDVNSTLGLPLATVPSADDQDPPQVLSLLEVPDIHNPSEAYTIEDAKRKSEADARALSTRSKQDRTRDVLQQMRQQLQELKALDASYPPESRLDDEEWEIDLDYGELLAKRGDEACEEVKRELAFAVEREELLLLKLRETYVSQLAVELLTLHAFTSGLSVQSFRTLKMPPLLQKRLNEIHLNDAVQATKQAPSSSFVVNSDGGIGLPSQRPSVLHIMAKGVELDDSFPLKDEERKLMQRGNTIPTTGLPPPPTAAGHHGDPTSASGSGASSTGASVHGFEARKRLRADRKERLNAWMANKPGENADDPRDLVAIAFAQRNMGDYKLKTAPNYVVPEAQRVNAAKKRRQMALLEEQIYEAKLGFNAKVLELRELKLLLLQEMRSDQGRVEQLTTWLGSDHDTRPSERVQLPLEVDLSEWPEQRERVSDADIMLFLKDRTVKPHAIVAANADPFVSGKEGAARRRKSSAVPSEINIDGKRVELTDRTIAAVSRCLGSDSRVSQTSPRKVLHVRHVPIGDQLDHGPVSEPEPRRQSSKGDTDERAIRAYVMRHEIQRLERKQRDEIAAFDDAVAHLRREKMRLDVVLKQCELTLFTLRSELVLLEQLESRENLLSAKLEKSKSDKAAVVAELHDIQESIASKKKEVDEWTKQEKAIQAEFLTLVNGGGGGSVAPPQATVAGLQKIFKRKLKRTKKKPTGGSGSKDGGVGDGDGSGAGHDGQGKGGREEEEDEDEEDEDEDDSDVGDDDDDDDDDEDDVCPLGCELPLYEKVLALRERRADADDALGELTRAMDELRKSSDRHSAKQRQIDKELQTTELDIQTFQSEKQTRFNQLDVVVALSTQQLRCLEYDSKWTLPEQASSRLVVEVASLDALADRIESLQRENKLLRQQFKDLHKQQTVLAKAKTLQQHTIAQIQLKCEQLQMLKFGQLVDMELLDKACDTTQLAHVQAKVRAKEMDAERELAQKRQMHQQRKREILEATQHNTELLGRVAQLHARQCALEQQLNRGTSGVLEADASLQQQAREMRERSKLVQIVKLQAREVDALKQEIGLLRGKDGKVYAPR